MNRARRTLAIAGVALITLVGLAVGPGPAAAIPPDPPDPEPPCEWESGQWGTHSGCDGLSPLYPGTHWQACNSPTHTGITVDVADIGPSGRKIAEVLLTYTRGQRTSSYPSGICRTAHATLRVLDRAATDCYAKVERNYDRQAYRASARYGDGFVDTQVVYDAGVTSYAWGYCKLDGRVYTARTRNY